MVKFSLILVGAIGIAGYHQAYGYTPTPITTSTTSTTSLSATALSRRNVLAGIAFSSTTMASPLIAGANGEEGFTQDSKGISYKIITPGTEEGPTARGQKVTLSYTLSLDGFVIDGKTSSPVGRTVESTSGLLGDKPITFPIGVNQVIKGWDYSVKTMKVGERRLVKVPPELGYGKNSMKAAIGGVDIPSNSVLYFDLTLKSVGPEPVLTDKQRQWLAENPE